MISRNIHHSYLVRNTLGLCLITASLIACDSTSTTTEGGQTFGPVNQSTEDNFDDLVGETDSDGDNLLDSEELLIGTDPLWHDSDDDGITDDRDDLDGDGVSNFIELTYGSDPTEANSTPDTLTGDDSELEIGAALEMDTCEDPNSLNASWSDNCHLVVDGQYADSTYALGVQRILWCQGYDNEFDLETFATGVFDEDTSLIVRRFQTANVLSADGVVRSDTWDALFSKLVLISSASDYDTYGIEGPNCTPAIPHFYQMIEDNQPAGWKIAQAPGSANHINFGTNP